MSTIPEDDPELEALRDAWDALDDDHPDTLDLVLDSHTMMAVHAADRYERVAWLQREAIRGGSIFRGSTREITERSLRLELAAGLGISEHAVEELLYEAEALTTRYEGMLLLLTRATVTIGHAKTFVELVDTVEEELREQVVSRALALAAELPLPVFRRRLRTLVERVRASTLERRHTEALAERRVVLQPGVDGMAWLNIHLPAVEAHAAYDRLTRMSRALGDQSDETRPRDHLRADIAADLLLDGRSRSHPKKIRGIRPVIAVTVPALTLLDDARAATEGPATVEGIGPIPLATARELAGAATGWMRVLTHPETGTVLSIGRRKYRPPPDMQRFVRFRAGRCTAPGCTRSADHCEIDHTIAWSEGGQTQVDNLNPLCPGHHTVKGDGGWHVTQVDGGAMRWVTPSGRVHTVTPERRIPVFRPSSTAPVSATTATLAAAPF